MIRCPLCAGLVHLNLHGVPVCDTPGCGDGPIPSPERYAALQREWSVPVVFNFCTPADLGRRAEPSMEELWNHDAEMVERAAASGGIINPAPLMIGDGAPESVIPVPPGTFTEAIATCHFFLDGNEIARQALENMPRVVQ